MRAMNMNRIGMRCRLFCGLLSMQALIGSQAHAQMIWHTPTDGNWSDATRWTGNDVPDSDEELAQISVCNPPLCVYNVDFDQSVTIGGLIMFAPYPSVDISVTVISGVTMAIGGPTWSVNSGSVRINANAALRCDIPALTMTGNGPLYLNGGRVIAGDPVSVITNAAPKMVKGTGSVECAFENYGRMEASGSESLVLSGAPKVNRALITAVSLGRVTISGTTLDNSGGLIAGRLLGNITFRDSTISGGDVYGDGPVGTGAAQSFGTCRYSGVRFLGAHEVQLGARLIVLDSVNCDGVIVINPLASPGFSVLSAGAAATSIVGAGDVTLNADPADLDSAQLVAEASGSVLTLGPQAGLRGTGRIRVDTVHQGRIAPGFLNPPTSTAGRLDILGHSFVMTSTTQVEAHLNGTATGQFDRLTSDSNVTLNGRLDLTTEGFASPAFHDEFPIITAASVTGRFARLAGWELPAGLAWRVRYAPTSATVVVTCPLDLDGDYQIGLGDLAVLLAHFGATGADSSQGNFDGDTDVDLQDLATLLAAFGTAC